MPGLQPVTSNKHCKLKLDRIIVALSTHIKTIAEQSLCLEYINTETGYSAKVGTNAYAWL